MTVQPSSDMARLAQLAQRVQALEDVNAIRHLKARYAAYCDDQYDAEGIAALFTEDAVWESQGLGRFAGRDAIRAFFQGASQLFPFAIHYSLNGQIAVQGDTARARWYLFMPCTLGAGNRATLLLDSGDGRPLRRAGWHPRSIVACIDTGRMGRIAA